MVVISFLYRGRLPDGTVFDDSADEPHEIVTGRAHVMPVLEEALLEMEVGEERTLEIAAKDAYGEYDEEGVQKVPTYRIPNGENMPEGETILWTSPRNSRPIPVRVAKIVNQVAYLDFNHPLAGKDIVYWVKVTGRKDEGMAGKDEEINRR
jgi:FKBP-type peptidyl-prolyl cis-trans isomerase 2